MAATILVSQTAEAQQPTTLTLVCEGCEGDSAAQEKPGPVSMGIIVNFTAGTVQGLGVDYSVKIETADDALINFLGDNGERKVTAYSITLGSIDRVTGKLEASTSLYLRDKAAAIRTITYTLNCIPAQRKF
jgi:hypothetical protein